MNIHKTKIEWCSHTWNPVTGCRHDCPYCYARRIATRFGPKIDEFPDESGITAFINEGVDCYVVEKPTELKDWQGNYRRSTPYPKNFAPTLHKYTLTYPEKRLTPAAIFVGSMADLFGRWVPDDWILARNGYAVRQAKEKRGTSKSYTYFVEYWKEGGKPL